MKPCPKCDKAMRPFLCRTNPPASEWYCKECHVSVLMTEEEYTQILQVMQKKQFAKGEAVA